MADKAKVEKSLTDYELVEAAERLTKHNSKDDLPARYSLLELAQAEQALNMLAAKFLQKHGSRLEGLAPALYLQLKSWNY